MKDRAQELKAERARGKGTDKAAAEAKAVLEKIAEMPPKDRALAKKLHALITDAAPDLAPKLWYGMPTYTRDGKNVCFFQPASKFKSRYSTLGFDEHANLDAGSMWPTSWALTELTEADEKKIRTLVRKAVR